MSASVLFRGKVLAKAFLDTKPALTVGWDKESAGTAVRAGLRLTSGLRAGAVGVWIGNLPDASSPIMTECASTGSAAPVVAGGA